MLIETEDVLRPGTATPATGSIANRYLILFLISGFPALLYQLVWQRALFTIYGVNVESVTVVVTVFILGLGLGSLAGGRLSAKSNVRLLPVFAAIEATIAVFGFFSLSFFHGLARSTAGAGAVKTGVCTFVLIAVPTLLMGSTLPLMVAHVVRDTGNVGRSVGSLYAVNTCGSAIACFAAAFFLMRTLGESGTVRFAAAINLAVACTALLWSRSTRSSQIDTAPGRDRRTMSFPAALLICGTGGFVSLGYEILWYRLYSFASGGSASIFAILLGCFLAGIAWFSLSVGERCLSDGNEFEDSLAAAAAFAVFGGVIGHLVGPVLGWLAPTDFLFFSSPVVFTAAGMLGTVFPLVSHAAINPAQNGTGRRVSYLYLANICGSALGSFVVGFVLMDLLPAWRISEILLLLSAGVAGLLLLMSRRFPRSLAYAAATLLIVFSGSGFLFDDMYERMLYGKNYEKGLHFARSAENRSGVIAVDPVGTVYGGGVYDGRFSVDPIDDVNQIWRALAIPAFCPKPEEVLMVGLASGSWAQIVANNPEVKRLTIVEINPGYLPLIREHSEVSSLLTNPKVRIVIDDGRRWMTAKPETRVDLIVMNTTFHWRAHVSSLLSTDFLELVRRHLKPGGIVYYNTTWSPRAMATATATFPHVLRVGNFIAASDSPISVNRARWEIALRNYRIDGRPMFDTSVPKHSETLQLLLAIADTVGHPGTWKRMPEMESDEFVRRRAAGVRLITDDNMGEEWP